MMKAVVFGGSGFLGSHVADSLTEEGFNVVVFDINTSPYLKDNQEMVIGNILNEDDVDNVVKDADYVFNFAGIADLDDATTKPLKTIQLNILGACNILEACRKYDIKRIIYASSIYVHSEKGGFYRCSKQSAELYVEEYNKKYGLPFTILRYGTLYGPRSDERNSIYRYIKQAFKQKEIICSGTGNEIREYIHVKDAANLSVKVLEEKYINKHIILTGHHGMRSGDMLNMIKDILGNSIDISYRGIESEEHYNITPYSFKPKYSFKLVNNCYRDMGQGLLECIHQVHNDIYESIEKL